MKIIAINGSPRKNWNTATILENVLKGATAVASDVDSEHINLYDRDYKGCISCFQCKLIGGKSYGRCVVNDDLKPILDKIIAADAVVFGSPIYFSDMTAMARAMFERLCFPLFTYDKNYTSLAPKKVRTAFIYTMNVPENTMEQSGYPQRLKVMENFVGRIFGYPPHVQYVNNTLQFNDYKKYKAELFSEEEKKKYRAEHFPEDCKAAYQLGASLIMEVQAASNKRTE